MQDTFITNIQINKLRNLKDTSILLNQDEKKHLIITGQNGSGKTTLLDAMADYLNDITLNNDRNGKKDLVLEFNRSEKEIYDDFQNGDLVIAYYPANRSFYTEQVSHVEKIELENQYSIFDRPSSKFVKYLVDMKVTQALSLASNKKDKADQIEKWFESLENLLKIIFDDSTLELIFDEERFQFFIRIDGNISFDFNSLSSGFASVLDIVVDLMMRMEKNSNRKFDYQSPGIVLIDEIETHLHLKMQRNILNLLTSFFPNIQFIVTTHSPFVLNCMNQVIIYDLQNKILVKDGLNDVPYEGIVEGYFNVTTLSKQLLEKFNKFKTLVHKDDLSDEDYAQIARLEQYLDEIPDYLALEITTEYQMLKLEFERKWNNHD